MTLSLDAALQRHTIARRQHAAALKELAATERANLRAICPIATSSIRDRIAETRRALDAAEAELAAAPARTVWAFLIKVETLAEETMTPEAAALLRRDASALLDQQSRSAAA